jgi:hypothetical protein
MPFVTIAGLKDQSGSVSFKFSFSDVTLDTAPNPILTYLPSVGNLFINVKDGGSPEPASGVSRFSGDPISSINNAFGQIPTGQNMNVNSMTMSGGLIAVRGSTGQVGAAMSPPEAPTCTPTTDGGGWSYSLGRPFFLPAGTYFYRLYGMDVNGNSTVPGKAGVFVADGQHNCLLSWKLQPGQVRTGIFRGSLTRDSLGTASSQSTIYGDYTTSHVDDCPDFCYTASWPPNEGAAMSASFTTSGIKSQELVLNATTFAGLDPQARNGTLVFCSDCVPGSSPLAGGGTGALVIRVNGGWKSL